jgi:ATP-dependent RNA helicase SUPV3L1/SUV3
VSGLARGLAYQLTENLGVIRREAAAADIKALDQNARGQLRKYGVRFGAFNVYLPALLKPAAADLVLSLWALHSGRDHGIDIEDLPLRPQQGLTSVEAGSAIPEPYWRAAGFYVAGSRAVRIDMLERLSDLIRTRVAFRTAEGLEAPAGATGDGGFRVVPELMSVVGCSGDEFASILKSLGFRRERRRSEPGEAPSGEPNAAEAIAIDEIWRPGKKRGPHQDKVEDRKSRQKMRAKPQRREPPQRPPRRAEAAERKKLEDSPFAALAALKGRLSARQPQGS